MDYIIPNVPLECLQAILKAIIQAQDPEATFGSPTVPAPEEAKESTIGK